MSVTEQALEHLDALYSYAMSLTHRSAEAEDLVQEAYLKLLTHTAEWPPQLAIKPYLFTVIRNLWLNQRRSRTRAAAVDWDDELAESVSAGMNCDPLVLFAREEQRRRVASALSRLSLAFREVVILRDLEEFSYKEIADIVGCPVGTVMSRLARARGRLKALLDDDAARVRRNVATG